jgi:hypothetical protein
MATFIQLATDLVMTLLRLLTIINGARHGILQGTHEAVLAEAQGAQIGPGGFSHLNDLQGTLRDVTSRETALNNVLNQLAGEQPNLGARVRAVLRPLLDQSSAYRSAMTQTEQMAAELAQTDGQRLSGVVFGQGGAGPEVGRTSQALISTQMTQRAKELADRGVTEPTRLIPSARAASAQVGAAIRQLPISIRDASDKVASIIGAIRVLLAQSVRQALFTGNLALAQALNSVERALAQASARLAAAGSRLTTPFIVIDVEKIKRQFGIVYPDKS